METTRTKGQVNAKLHCVFDLKVMTVDKHEYYKMIPKREARIRAFMQPELEACLEELNWMIRCHNCEALNYPQEKYPAKPLSTPPPNYIDNLQSTLIKVQKEIYPPSLKIILKTSYNLPVARRPAPKTSMQPDDVIGGHRAGENSPQTQGDPSPRRAAVDTGSEEPGTPPRSPAIGTGPGPGVSRAKTSMEEEGLFSSETSMDGFLYSNCTSPEQECILFKSNIGVDDNNEITSQQGAVCDEFARPTKKRQQQGMIACSTNQNRQFDRGRSRVNPLLF